MTSIPSFIFGFLDLLASCFTMKISLNFSIKFRMGDGKEDTIHFKGINNYREGNSVTAPVSKQQRQ